MNRLIGNSIVVNVLTEIFREMFVGRYGITARNPNVGDVVNE